MNEVITFTNPEFGRVRTIDIDEVTWFVGKDVANALGYSNSSKAVSTHVEPEDKQFVMLDIADSQNGNVPIGQSKTNIINESGLYSLILSSKLPSAKKFKRWITSEVLPAIRRTGAYRSDNDDDSFAEPQRNLTVDDYMKAAQIIASCRNERLPYVTMMLSKAGIEVIPGAVTGGGIDLSKFPQDRENGLKAVDYINTAINRYGWSAAAIGQLVGLDRVQICRYRHGRIFPREPRASIIINALTNAIPALADEIKND
jgi:prophage antirepressor-like protein